MEKRFAVLFDSMLSKSLQVKELVSLSFLSESLKSKYTDSYAEKMEMLKA